MTDLQTLFAEIDRLSPDEFEQLKQYVEQRQIVVWGIVPPENLAKIQEIMQPVQEDITRMTEEEINEMIDQALAEVRNEPKA
jgi:hypothetical protein